MNRHFSRRDFVKLGLAGVGATFLAACQRALEPTGTALPAGNTDTPTPSALIPTSTQTVVPTPTALPLQFEDTYGAPVGVFASNYKKGLAGFTDRDERGATFTFAEDPTGKFGRVLIGTIKGAPYWEEGDNAFKRRAYPYKYFHDVQAPVRFTEWIYMGQSLWDSLRQTKARWWSHITFGDSNDLPGYGTYWNAPLTTSLNGPDAENWVLNFFPHTDWRTGWRAGRMIEGAPKFTPEQWHCMQVDIDKTGHTRLFQDSAFISEGDLIDSRRSQPGNRPLFQAIRGGPIYVGGESDSDAFPQGATVMTANLKIEWWGAS